MAQFAVVWTPQAVDKLTTMLEDARHAQGNPEWVLLKLEECLAEGVSRLVTFPDLRNRYRINGLWCNGMTLRAFPAQVFFRLTSTGSIVSSHVAGPDRMPRDQAIHEKQTAGTVKQPLFPLMPLRNHLEPVNRVHGNGVGHPTSQQHRDGVFRNHVYRCLHGPFVTCPGCNFAAGRRSCIDAYKMMRAHACVAARRHSQTLVAARRRS